MKDSHLNIISKNLKELMKKDDKFGTQLELAKASNITYSSLNPIINGERDFAVTKLVKLANALNCDPNTLLSGTYNQPIKSEYKLIKPAFYISCISIDQITYCSILNVNNKQSNKLIIPQGVACDNNAEHFIQLMIEKIHKEISNFEPKKASVFFSVQAYEYTTKREKIIEFGKYQFLDFVLQADWSANYKAFIENSNGICITIGNGLSIVYSQNNGNTLNKIAGLGFPISDDGGNLWLGCQAIRHAIDVKENLCEPTYLSDRILSLFNSDLYAISEQVSNNYIDVFITCSRLVKETAHKQSKSKEIIEQGFLNIMSKIKSIDKLIGTELPIVLTGESAFLYEDFFDKSRVVKTAYRHEEILQQYGLDFLQK
ncbi:XRE family transcriptional regulator [Thiotrichales bacterium 19S3-7]|nr:XRE family transcriptional regulator [Thiotrichales bacterium 19S3-7]MCF6802804.1 XRE family transcriptional regulator [Thiotrichales bacterium 19S3-11]